MFIGSTTPNDNPPVDLDKIPTVDNKADYSRAVVEKKEEEAKYNSASLAYWELADPKQIPSYKQGAIHGKHIFFSPDVQSNIWVALTTLKHTILEKLLTTAGKSPKEIKKLLDVQRSIDEYIVQLNDMYRVKIPVSELKAYMHGFINSIVDANNIYEDTNDIV